MNQLSSTLNNMTDIYIIEEHFPWLLPAFEEIDPDSVLDSPFN